MVNPSARGGYEIDDQVENCVGLLDREISHLAPFSILSTWP